MPTCVETPLPMPLILGFGLPIGISHCGNRISFNELTEVPVLFLHVNLVPLQTSVQVAVV